MERIISRSNFVCRGYEHAGADLKVIFAFCHFDFKYRFRQLRFRLFISLEVFILRADIILTVIFNGVSTRFQALRFMNKNVKLDYVT